MAKKEARYASGLSFLSDADMIKLEGQCVAVIDGRIAYHNPNPVKVLDEMKKREGKEKIFTCVPNSRIALIK